MAGPQYAGVQKYSTSPDNRPSLELIEEAVAFIHQSAAWQLEYIQTIIDSATLAAEQVQDKRLETLERGPEVTGFDILLSFALRFLLESPIAGRILQLMTQKVLLPRVRAHLGAKEYARRTSALRSRAPLPGGRRPTYPIGKLDVPDELRAKQLAEEIGKLQRLNDILRETTPDEGVYPYIIAAAKAANDQAGKERRPKPEFEAIDSPGVSILDLVQTWASKQRLSILIEQSMYEFWVRTDQFPIQEIFRLLKWNAIEVDGRVFTLSEVKDRYKRYFEVLVWSLLLYKQPFTANYDTTYKQRFLLTADYVPASLFEYWVRRFIDPQTGRPFSETPALKRPDGKSDWDRSRAKLGQYMQKIAEAAARNNIELFVSGPSTLDKF